MPRFIVVHSGVPFSEAQLKELAKVPLPSGIAWNRTYCDFSSNNHFCEWEAPNKEAVEQVLRENNIPFDALYPVRLFDVPTANLEP